MTQAILYLTDKVDAQNIQLFCEEATDARSSVYILFNQKEGGVSIPLSESLQNRVYAFQTDIICQSGYKPIGDGLIPGNAHIPVLRFFAEHPDYDYYWVVEDDVRYTGRWKDFFSSFVSDDSDLLASYITHYEDDMAWTWWYTFSSAEEKVKPSDMVRSFNPIYRLSNRALKAIHEKMTIGWSGHFEVLIPTILSLQGMKMTDLGENDALCHNNDGYRYYDKSTMSHKPLFIQAERRNMLYHPVKEKKSIECHRKNCVISAVGRNSLHRHWVENANDRDFDLHLIVYDNSFGAFCNDADYLGYKKGFKLKLVYDYLKAHQEYIERYEYFFIPDDDIMASAVEIDKLFSVMDAYHLKIAQPALRHSYYTHPLTLRKPLAILRYVDFVEMMLPCFSREALKDVLETFNANESGWGVEYHWRELIKSDKKDMAVIDAVAMQHTQPVKQGRTGNLREMQEYIINHHLSLAQNEYGCVLDSSRHASARQYLYATKSIQAMHTIVQKLLIRLRSGEIRKLGLDGQAGIALLLNEASYMTENKTLKDVALQIIKYAESLSADVELQKVLSSVKEYVLAPERTIIENKYRELLEMSERQYEQFGTELFSIKVAGWKILYDFFYHDASVTTEN